MAYPFSMSFRLPWHSEEQYPGSVPIPPHVIKLFYSRVRRSHVGNCWPYIPRNSPLGPRKYRMMRWRVKGRVYVLPAHRLALMLRLNRPPGPKMMACHACNNAKCCNPWHVYEGTAQDNADDRKRYAATKGKVVMVRRRPAITCDPIAA